MKFFEHLAGFYTGLALQQGMTGQVLGSIFFGGLAKYFEFLKKVTTPSVESTEV